MAADDRDTPLPSGWLPPRAPTHHVPEAPPPPAPGAWPRDPGRHVEPSSPAAVFAITLGASSILLLGVTLGVAFPGSTLLSAIALWVATRLRHAIAAGRPGRESQARAGIIVAWIGLALAVVAGIAWVALSASGFTPQDLQEALEREVERRRNRG